MPGEILYVFEEKGFRWTRRHTIIQVQLKRLGNSSKPGMGLSKMKSEGEGGGH